MTKLRVGIFGGSFSPPHRGHLLSAKRFIEAEGLDELLVIPAHISPGKTGSIAPNHRLEMCRLAFAQVEKAKVLDIEIARGGQSYTVDTLSALAGEDRELYLLCGTDTALALDTWKSPERLFSLAKIVCIPRDYGEIALALGEKNKTYLENYGGEVKLLSASPYPLSSTYIRELIKSGKKEDYALYLSGEVIDYIEQNGLYQ